MILFSKLFLMPTLHSDIPKKLDVDVIQLHKMAFVYNAVNDGWKVEMRDGKYVFSKRHEGKKEIYLDSYLETFVSNNVDISKVI